MVAIKLYNIPLVIDLTLVDRGVKNNNMPFRDSDFKVYRGTFNPVEFIVRDNDRKPVSLIGKSVTLTVINFFNKVTVTQKDVAVIDPTKGKIKVIFTPQEIVEWENGFYQYSVLINNEDGTNNLVFVDQHQTAGGFFEMIDGVLPELVESVRALGEDFTPVNIAPPTSEPTNFISSAFPGDAVFCEEDGLHTAVVYLTDYAGRFFIQASLEDLPSPNDADWFDIHLTMTTAYFEFGNTPKPEDTFTGLEAFTFTGSLRWVRFKHIPDDDNTGTLDQVLYRN